MKKGQSIIYGLIFKRYHKKLVRLLFNASCVIVAGDRGTGKSALFCVADEIFENVISNYPTTFSRQLPTDIVRGRAVFNKDLLYSLDTYVTNYYIAAEKVPIDTLLYWQDVLTQEVENVIREDIHRDSARRV